MLTPDQAQEVAQVARHYRKIAVQRGVTIGIAVGVVAAMVILWAMGLGRCP